MAPASQHAGGGLHEPAGVSETAPLDLDLRLGPPVVVAPKRSNGLAPSNDLRQAAENGENYVERGAEHMASNSGGAEQNATAADAPGPVLWLQMFDVAANPVVSASSGDPRTPEPDQHAGDDEKAAAEPRCKRAKSEPPPPLLVQPQCAPPAAARQLEQTANNVPLPAAHQAEDAGAITEPAWLRAELLPRHGLRADLPLHFVEDKVLTNSDLNPVQNRLLVTSTGSTRLRAVLTCDEVEACGLAAGSDDHHRRDRAVARGEKKRAAQRKNPGVPVLVHDRDAGRGPTMLRLTTFHSTTAMVINGAGYRDVVEANGFVTGDCVEVWAFRRPRDQQLCLVVARRDDDRRPAINRQE
ncbi:hypothetical protein QOZ80_3BG0258260 [Eleusine coracana subsp. coracana]|nr:hypothetical protein QOZ80_3BG0258260 [Eleusine coracana subsp. coracana]